MAWLRKALELESCDTLELIHNICHTACIVKENQRTEMINTLQTLKTFSKYKHCISSNRYHSYDTGSTTTRKLAPAGSGYVPLAQVCLALFKVLP